MLVAESFDKHWAADQFTGCWNWQRGCGSWGYGQLYHRRKMVRAHRFSYERYVGPIPKGLLVLHHCDNPRCVNPSHLFLGTNTDNMRDMILKGRGRHVRGMNAHFAKLTAVDIERIHDIYRSGATTQAQIADYFDIDQTNVSLIVRRRSWAWAA